MKLPSLHFWQTPSLEHFKHFASIELQGEHTLSLLKNPSEHLAQDLPSLEHVSQF